MKVGFKQPLSAGLMLDNLAHLVLWVWVQDKSRCSYRQTSKVSLYVLHHGAKSTLPSHMPTKQNTNPTATMFKAILLQPGLFRIAELPTPPQHHSLPQYYPLALAWCQSLLLPLALLLRVPRVGFHAPVLAQVPMSPIDPHLPSRHLGVGPLTLAPLQTLGPARARSTVFIHLS